MKKLFSKRLETIDLNNRFSTFYQIKPNPLFEVLDFGVGQDNQIISKEVIQEIKSSVENRYEYRYAEDGIPELSKTFSNFAYANYSVKLDDNSIFVSMGIKDALNMLAFILIDKGDLIVATSPGYNVFQRKAKMLGAEVRELKLLEERQYLPDLTNISPKDWERTKVLLLNYPNNPTGSIATEEFINSVIEYAERYNFLIINDAAYIDLCYNHNPLSFLKFNKKRVVELFSASKSFGLTGIRMGIVAGNEEIIEKLKKYRDQENSGQFVPLYYAYKIALEKVNLKEVRDKYIQRARIMSSIMAKLGFGYKYYQGTFYLYYRCPQKIDGYYCNSAYDFARYLKEKFSIIVIPYNESNSFRISLTYKNEKDAIKFEERLKNVIFKFD